MGFIDLHVHSSASDGSLTPGDLVQYACEKGLYAFALTDHDTVSGISAAQQASRQYPVHVIPGVELSSSLGGRCVHLLGYHVDYQDPRFLRVLRGITGFRDERNSKICAQLRSYGANIDYEDFRNRMGCRTITRLHFAAWLVTVGMAQSIQEAFEKYLAKERPCYVPMRAITTNEAAKVILRAGGIPVLAHPIRFRLTDRGYMQLFTLLKTFGVRGIEAIHPDNTMEDESRFRHMAKELDMIVTGGSDFHGNTTPDIDIGTGRGNIMVSSSILQDIL